MSLRFVVSILSIASFTTLTACRGGGPDGELRGAAQAERATPLADADPAAPAANAVDALAPAPAREEPKPAPVVLDTGTELPLVLKTTVSSAKSRKGGKVKAVLARDVRLEGGAVMPEGTAVEGTVLRAVPSGRVKGRARLVVTFDRLQYQGSHPIQTSAIDITAKSGAKRDAAMVVGGTIAGTVIGGLAGGRDSTKKGAVIGGAAGAGAALATKGKEVVLSAGQQVVVTVQEDVRLD